MKIFRVSKLGCGALFIFLALCCRSAKSADIPESHAPQGYYRFPTIFGDTIVFTAEGDLWRVGVKGGRAQRITSHAGFETHAAFSPDGKILAFSAEYEGPTEVYTMPADGGLPTRRTFEGKSAAVIGWTPDGKILYSTVQFSTLPDTKLATVDLQSQETTPLPLNQASDGVFNTSGKTLYFVRLPFQGSRTKRYQGGTIQHLWKYTLGDQEATPLTEDFPGTSKNPMLWQDRIYFVTDRDGTMNLWSMNPAGADLQQLTHHKGWDAKSASMGQGRIVYQLGADLHLYDIAAKSDVIVPITLTSDFDQERQRWVKKPMDYLTAAHISPDGDRIALTARGQVFVAPVKQGRFVEVTHDDTVRFREGQFMPDGKTILTLSDAAGELEFSQVPANGLGKPATFTSAGTGYRFGGEPSPDGKWVAYADKDYQLWISSVADKKAIRVDQSQYGTIEDMAWSPDSQWLAYVREADNTFPQIWIYSLKTGTNTPLTTDRVKSSDPVWDPDGKWIYFLSERHLESVVASPWGLREPEPFFDQGVGIFYVALTNGLRSPFQASDELHPDSENKKSDGKKEHSAKKDKPVGAADAKETKDTKEAKDDAEKKSDDKASDDKTNIVVNIDLPGLQTRVQAVPVPAADYNRLEMTAKHLFIVAAGPRGRGRGGATLKSLELSNDDTKLKTVAEGVDNYEMSADHKHLLIRKENAFYVTAADGSPPKWEKSVALDGWTFALNPREEWRQMFKDAWRLERDYFYDKNMHGVDWPAILNKNLPLVDRVTDREELSDLIAEMVGELSALHIFVRSGELRDLPDRVKVASLGARLKRDASAGGYRVEHIYLSDPDYPEKTPPLARPGVDVREGDIIESLNGTSVLSVPDIGDLLRNQAEQQVLVSLKGEGTNASRSTIVTPITSEEDDDLRYGEWEYTRRLKTEQMGSGAIGYIHLRAMGAADIAQWARDFYPVFNRQGLIIDVRHNRGGNIDSWILEKLMRKAWFYWQGRAGAPYWNMQYAFRGHMVVLCDERTASDGEAFTEGFKRLGLGKAIGTRTWGGEIWLSQSNVLVDKGIATAAENGVYGPEGKWLIEGHGVDPDIVVDNLPHATFAGDDAQLKRAIEFLQDEIKREPVTVPAPPPHPDKSLK